MSSNGTMSPPLNVVALISGGKDSLFSILHCVKNGHNVVALANLHPRRGTAAAEQQDDIDSFMYQTIGHNVVPLYAEALDLPLFRQEILGDNANPQQDYSHHKHSDQKPDETESLVPLLEKVKAAFPSVNAVSSGAILSNYQRTRVESVALRLGLTPLSYLWQYPILPPYLHTSLLDDMRNVEQRSRIIKVASGGLGSEHLWLDLTAAQSIKKLAKDLGRFSGLETGALLGEGGEFETLATSGPPPTWKGRLVVEDADRTCGTSEAGSWSIKISKATVQPMNTQDSSALQDLRIPPKFDDKFDIISKELAGRESNDALMDEAMLQSAMPSNLLSDSHARASETIYSNMTSSMEDADVAAQTHDIMNKLQGFLKTTDREAKRLSLIIILLRSMCDFAQVNSAYKQYFQAPGPPARVTIACGNLLARGAKLVISAIASDCITEDRKHLHVQSTSYWAPANIGPYSQAVSVPVSDATDPSRLVYVAGQIPLEPASMNLAVHGYIHQAVLALQHLWRVGQAMHVHWWLGGAVAFIPASSDNDARERAQVNGRIWRLAHELEKSPEDAEEEDIAERSLRGGWGHPVTENLRTPLWNLPDWEQASKMVPAAADQRPGIPPCYTVQVDELPRSAQVEWWSYGLELGQGLQEIKTPKFTALQQLEDVADARFASLGLEGSVAEIFCTRPWTETLAAQLSATRAVAIPCHRIFTSRGEHLELLIRQR